MKTARSTSAGARLLPDRKGYCWYALVHQIWPQGVLQVEGREGRGQDGLLFPLRGGEEDTRGMV